MRHAIAFNFAVSVIVVSVASPLSHLGLPPAAILVRWRLKSAVSKDVVVAAPSKARHA
jgi:hypothetical protein